MNFCGAEFDLQFQFLLFNLGLTNFERVSQKSVSVDNFNAVLYGYAIYYDLGADAEQKKFIAYDVDRLMTHLLDNQCRIIDVDGQVTQWGHVGMDPDPSRDEYYKQRYRQYLNRAGLEDAPWKPSLRSSLMLLPDLLIAAHITGKERYCEFYRSVFLKRSTKTAILARRISGTTGVRM